MTSPVRYRFDSGPTAGPTSEPWTGNFSGSITSPVLKTLEFVDGGIPRVFVKNSKSFELFKVVDLVADWKSKAHTMGFMLQKYYFKLLKLLPKLN